MAPVAVYDANVLYPSVLRDLLIRLAQAGLVQAKWTETILDETFTHLACNRPDLDPQRLARTRELMCQAVRDCLVTGFESRIEAVTLPDPDDRHVLAAAITAGADLIVTFNLKHFPAADLQEWNLTATSPDEFCLELFHRDPVTGHQVIGQIAEACRNPPLAASDVIDQLEAQGVTRTATELRR
jgi:predicted nucleic acid-binding protein